MRPVRIFINSVQKEFAQERSALRDYLWGDPLFRWFCDVFLFEDVPAQDRRADKLYLDEVEQCDIYIGLFGCDYGSEYVEGMSPTEHEFDLAGELSKPHFIFVKSLLDGMLDFCFDDEMLRLYKKLCRYYFKIDPEVTVSYVYEYCEMWDEKGGSIK